MSRFTVFVPRADRIRQPSFVQLSLTLHFKFRVRLAGYPKKEGTFLSVIHALWNPALGVFFEAWPELLERLSAIDSITTLQPLYSSQLPLPRRWNDMWIVLHVFQPKWSAFNLTVEPVVLSSIAKRTSSIQPECAFLFRNLGVRSKKIPKQKHISCAAAFRTCFH